MNSTNVPDWYACECCGARGVQLFRDYGYAMVELLCAPCAEWAISKPETAVPAIPVSLSGRGAWIVAGGDAGAMGEWWSALTATTERRSLFAIQSDAECIAVLGEYECLSVTATDAVNERDRVDEALAAMVARGLAPDNWPARVDVWDQESEDRSRSEEVFVRCGGIDRFALPAIMRNPIATTTAEQLLLGHVGTDSYAGVRSWRSVAMASRDSAKYLDTLPVAGIGESAVVERAVLSSVWKSAANRREDFEKLHTKRVAVATQIAEVMFSRDAPPWCHEVLRLGFGLWKLYPAERGGRATWGLVARDGSGFPWPTIANAPRKA